jgi:O-acetylhomoserine/O-acetylserine sulfhydrylase-like pyridoxal-dependent enzyme
MFAIAKFRDTRTIVTHPASTQHSKLSVDERLAVSITDGLVRVSCGLETERCHCRFRASAVIDFRFD